MLKPGGKSLHTCFLLDAATRAAIAQGNDTHGFRNPVDDFVTVNPASIGAAIASDEEPFARLRRGAGVELIAIHPGDWSSPGAPRLSHQAICIGRRD